MLNFNFCQITKLNNNVKGIPSADTNLHTTKSILITDEENICLGNLCQLIATSISCALLLFTGIYHLYKSRRTRYTIADDIDDHENINGNKSKNSSKDITSSSVTSFQVLFKFHNLRCACELLLLAINTLELCRALLPLPLYSIAVGRNGHMPSHKDTQDFNQFELIFYTTPFVISNSILAIFITLVTIGYHRILEIHNISEYLYLCLPLEFILSIIRIYQIHNNADSYMSLESCLNWSTGLCWIVLAVIDGFTIYKKKSKTKPTNKKISEEKIGYKHSISTFFSKIVFWWLTPFLWHGYQEPLEQEDLGYLREEDSARAYYDQFLLIYKTATSKTKTSSLWLCYLKSSWKWFTLGGILKLFGDLSALIGPLSIYQIVEYIEQEYNQSYINENPNNNNNNETKASNNTNNNNNNNNNNYLTPQNLNIIWSLLHAHSDLNHRILSVESTSQNDQITNNNSSITQKGYNQNNNFIRPLYSTASAGLELPTSVGGNLLSNISWIGQQIFLEFGTKVTNNYYQQQNQYHQHHHHYHTLNQYYYYYYPSWMELLSNGWIIAWIVLMASIAQGGLSQASTHLLNMTGIRIKTSLQGLIYRKTLLLSSSCIDISGSDVSSETGEGQKNQFRSVKDDNSKRKLSSYSNDSNNSDGSNSGRRDAGSITNLMSEDSLNIMSFFWIAHYVWAIPLKIGLVMYLLYLKLGISAIIGSFVCILTMTPLQFLIGKAMSKNSEISAQCTDERLRKTNDIFLGIKLIKLNAWEKVYGDKINLARKKELKYLNKDSFYWTVMTFLTHVSSVLITFVTLAVYVKLERTDQTNLNSNDPSSGIEFTASRLFSALALFNQLTVPLLIFPITVPIIISAIVSTKRLERFLQEPEVQKEFEGIKHMARILSKSDASLDMYEIKLPIQSDISIPSPITEVPPLTPQDILPVEIENNLISIEKHQQQDDKMSDCYQPIKTMKKIIKEKNTKNNDKILKITTTGATGITIKSVCDAIDENFENKPLPLEMSLCYNNVNNNNNNNNKNNNNNNELAEVEIRENCDENDVKSLPQGLINIKTTSFTDRIDCKDNNKDDAAVVRGLVKSKLKREYQSHTLPKKKRNKDLIRGGGGSESLENQSKNIICGEENSGCSSSGSCNTGSGVKNFRKLISGKESYQFQIVDSIAVSISNGVFSWDNCNTLLKIDELNIPRGKLTVVVGKNGSGKSSLLAALLKEMHKISGDISWNKYSTIAYVPQTPWLLNASIRDNILFGESFRPKRYEKVLEACALKPDIELMPEGDVTVIGERGINLSGGQKQRINIARALYSSANVIIMDDPLSSLDNEVAKHVFENSIRKMLLKANRTVVLVTQRLQLVFNADYIIVMKDGYVQSAGNYEQVEKNHPDVVLEWNSIMAKGNDKDQISPGKTARERWKLFKNISKIGLQHPQNTEQEHLMSTQSLYMQTKRRSNIFGSRHLIYDIPLPIDECQNDDIIIKRRGSRRSLLLMGLGNAISSTMTNSACESRSGTVTRKNSILRVNSLQPELRNSDYRQPVVRNISSPGRFNDYKTSDNEFKPKTGFRQFLSRMSSRRSNLGSRHHRALSASNSIQSISEESHSNLNRAESTSSEWLDDESVQDLNELNEKTLPLDEERKYGEIPLQIYLLYLKSCGLPIVLTFFITALIWQCLRVYTDVWLRNWTEMDSARVNRDSGINNIMYSYNKNSNKSINSISTSSISIEGNNKQELHDVTYCFNMYTIISSICILMSVISTPAGQKAGCNAREALHDQLLDSVLAKPLHFFQITPLGRILNRFSNDMAIIDKKITPTSQRLLQFTLLCLFAILINLAITPWFIVLTIPICIAYYIIQKFYRCSSRELQRLENITNSPVISHFNETIQGVTTIRAYGQESRFTETLFRRLEANTIAFIMLNTSNRWLGIALDYLGGIIVFIAIVTALVAASIAKGQSLNNSLDEFENLHYEQNGESNTPSPSPSLVGLAINYTLLVPIYLNWVVKLLADMEMYVGSVERVAYYQQKMNDNLGLGKSHEENYCDKRNAKNFVSCGRNSTAAIAAGNSCGTDEILCEPRQVVYTKVPISWPQRGDIAFEGVSLRYQGQKQNVISGLSLKIPAGQRFGICGRTGSGKSSLALSLFSVLEVVEGKILIDDVNINTIHSDEIRSRLSIIPQDVHLFNANIRENLDPRGHYSDLELWNCLELAQLKDVVTKMPQGLDTEIIEGGFNLSAGHRQLFCLARAVLRGSVCLVLDEATSSLDAITERALMDAAHNAFKGRTIVTIAHRLSTLLNYDRIIVLENGKIVEDGTPCELTSKPDSKFVTMLNSGNS